MAIRRRELILALTGVTAWPLRAVAQAPAKVHRIGLLSTGAPTTTTSPLGVALLRGLAGHGYELDRNLELESRGAEHHLNRLPAIYFNSVFSEAGGLAIYGPSILEMVRQAAGYVDRILRGEKPGDLPFQQPTTYRLLINVKTAAALGLTIPPTLLASADEVIE
jgi:hypothetical protein